MILMIGDPIGPGAGPGAGPRPVEHPRLESPPLAWQPAAPRPDDSPPPDRGRHPEPALQTERVSDVHDTSCQAQGRFLAHLAHELRNPASAIFTTLELSLDEELPPAVREYLETAMSATRTLLTLLNEILDSARLESGEFCLRNEPFALGDLLGETVRRLAPSARAKGLKLICDVSADVPDRLAGDPLRLQQILTNLIANAVKFTQRGKVSVRVDVQSHEADDICLLLAVADTGIGISPEDQQRIFIPFAQAETAGMRQNGIGLGLAIAASLAKKMDGHLWVRSELGQGSTFYCSVRVRQPRAGPLDCPLSDSTGSDLLRHEPAEDTLQRHAPRALRILLAEDVPDCQRLIATILRKRGHTVEIAHDGPQTLELLSRSAFDLVLMDVQMPQLDGFQATQFIRAMPDPRKARLPILALTAQAMVGDEERCLAAGMDGHLAKPIDSHSLIEAVERFAGGGVR